MITGIYAGLIGLLLVVLSLRVIGYRRDKGVSLGSNGDRILERRIRAQGNLTEYAPIGLILLGLSELQETPEWRLHVLGLILLAGRLSHAAALSSPTPWAAPRVAGMILTFTALIGLSLNTIALPLF